MSSRYVSRHSPRSPFYHQPNDDVEELKNVRLAMALAYNNSYAPCPSQIASSIISYSLHFSGLNLLILFVLFSVLDFHYMSSLYSSVDFIYVRIKPFINNCGALIMILINYMYSFVYICDKVMVSVQWLGHEWHGVDSWAMEECVCVGLGLRSFFFTQKPRISILLLKFFLLTFRKLLDKSAGRE